MKIYNKRNKDNNIKDNTFNKQNIDLINWLI